MPRPYATLLAFVIRLTHRPFPLTVRCCGIVLMAFLVVLHNPFLNIEMILAVVTRKGDRCVMGLLVMTPMIMLALETFGAGSAVKFRRLAAY
jgi:hypothetical protein